MNSGHIHKYKYIFYVFIILELDFFNIHYEISYQINA